MIHSVLRTGELERASPEQFAAYDRLLDERRRGSRVAGRGKVGAVVGQHGMHPVGLAITHIFPCSINGLLASLKGVSFCAEPFEGAPFRVILSGSNIDRGRNYNCPCGWSKMWVIASVDVGVQRGQGDAELSRN